MHYSFSFFVSKSKQTLTLIMIFVVGKAIKLLLLCERLYKYHFFCLNFAKHKRIKDRRETVCA